MNNQSRLIGGKWMLKGKLHREDGPAVEYKNGTKYWYQHGELHREGGPAFIRISDESKEELRMWLFKGKYHRVDGPAIEWANGIRHWYVDGNRHRIDGPAVEYINGYKEWHINGIKLSQEEWFNKLTSEQQNNYLWKLNE